MYRIGLTIIVIALIIGMVPATPSRASSSIRAGQIKHTTVADFARGSLDGTAVSIEQDGEIVISAGGKQGQYTSSVVKTDFPFNAVGLIWDDDLASLHQVELEMRTSLDGRTWKDWRPVEDGDVVSNIHKHSSELHFNTGNYVQYRLSLTADEQGQAPMVKEVTVKYIDSTVGPDLATATRAASARALGVNPSGQPLIVSRAEWGADDAYTLATWPPEYTTVRTAVVHHTDTPMNTDPVVALRAIWYDHAVIQGWGDIGYNYLIDASGRIYEGRYGGDNVVGGHAGSPYNSGSLGVAIIGTYSSLPVGPLPLTTLENLLAWKLDRFGIDPKGAGWFYDRYTNNIMGHLDVGPTACPGSAFYGQLPGVRNRTKFRTGWGAHSTPQRMLPGQTVWVSLGVQNRGATTWTSGGGNPFDLGYHWYDSNGYQYFQSVQDDHRAAMPQAVGYDQWVTVNALLTAPTIPGTYRLEWDMVQENVAWFSAYGNSPLVTTIVVEQTTVTPTATPSATPTATATATRTSTPTATPTPVPPSLAVEPSYLGFVTLPGSTPGQQQVRIQNSGSGTFQWQATPSSTGGWLKISRATGSPGDPLVVSIDQAAIGSVTPPLARDGYITISAPGAIGSPKTVAVHLAIVDRVYASYFPQAYKSYGSGW